MFNLFGKKKKDIGPKPIYTADNPLFKRFPLQEAELSTIRVSVEKKMAEILDTEAAAELLTSMTELPSVPVNLKRLQFESFGWEKVESEQRFDAYVCEKTGNYLLASQDRPNGSLKDMNIKVEFPMYRDWLRDQMAHNGGGLIFCETFKHKGVSGYEAIAKLPKPEGENGTDYYYFLNIHNFEDDRIEQLRLTVKELGGAGVRETLLKEPLTELLDNDPDKFINYFRLDPYNPTYNEGNVHSAAEMEVFDQLFPIHPLSVLRMHLRPRLLDSLIHLEMLPEGTKDDDDIEVEYEEL
jgi:hypothetical protein